MPVIEFDKLFHKLHIRPAGIFLAVNVFMQVA